MWGLRKQDSLEFHHDTAAMLKGSWDLVTRVISWVTILITPIKVLITLLTKSHDPPSSADRGGPRGLGKGLRATVFRICCAASGSSA